MNIVSSLSTKMNSVTSPEIKMGKNFNKERRSVSRDKLPIVLLEDLTAEESNNFCNIPESPGNKMDYDRRLMDETYARGIFKTPKASSANKIAKSSTIPFRQVKSDDFEGEEFMSFGSFEVNIDNVQTEK
jgi:hypothetical protein